MTARDILQPFPPGLDIRGLETASAGTSLFDLVQMMAEGERSVLLVAEEGINIGIITARDVLGALSTWFAARDDASTVVLECQLEDYSASLIAHAVEDADAHLLSLLTAPSEEGMRVTLRVRLADPSPAIRSLERYGFRVIDATGAPGADMTALDERLAALQAFLDV